MPSGVYPRTEYHRQITSKALMGKPSWRKGLKGIYIGEKAGHWKGGKHLHKGYILIYCPNHPHKIMRFYVREHRLIMEKHIGRYLLPEEIVHHLNGDITDNRIENLQLFSNHSEHMRFCKHNQGRRINEISN